LYNRFLEKSVGKNPTLSLLEKAPAKREARARRVFKKLRQKRLARCRNFLKIASRLL
jgi:hypothetical protein